MSFVNLKFDSYSALVNAVVLCEISCYTGTRYIDTRMYIGPWYKKTCLCFLNNLTNSLSSSLVSSILDCRWWSGLWVCETHSISKMWEDVIITVSFPSICLCVWCGFEYDSVFCVDITRKLDSNMDLFVDLNYFLDIVKVLHYILNKRIHSSLLPGAIKKNGFQIYFLNS